MLPYQRQSWYFLPSINKEEVIAKRIESRGTNLAQKKMRWNSEKKMLDKKQKKHESWFLLNEPNWESSFERTKGFIVTKFSEILLERDFVSKKTKWYQYQNFILAFLHLKLLELLSKRIHSYIFSKKFHIKRKITYL